MRRDGAREKGKKRHCEKKAERKRERGKGRERGERDRQKEGERDIAMCRENLEEEENGWWKERERKD